MLEAEVVTSSQTMKNIEGVFFTERRWEKFSYSYNIVLSVVFHDNPVLRWAGGSQSERVFNAGKYSFLSL